MKILYLKQKNKYFSHYNPPLLSSRPSEARGEISKDPMRFLDFARNDKTPLEVTADW